MAVYSKTLYQLRQSVAYSFDDCIVAQVTSNGTTTTVISTSLTKGDDYYNGYDCHFYLGTHKDISREVADFDSSTDTLTITPALANASDVTDYFELHKKYTTAQYNDAINRAIELGKDVYLLDKKDESLTFTSGVYEYAVPNGFRYISQIYHEDINDDDTYYVSNLIDSRKWWIVPVNSTNSLIKFADNAYSIGSDLDGKKMRIIGQCLQSNLSNDSDICNLPSEYVIQMARAIMLAQTSGKESEANLAYRIAQDEWRKMIIPPKGVSVFEV